MFPSPKDIVFTLQLSGWASMRKHVAAVLYGIGVRLDQQPELLFTLRKVDQQDLMANAGADLSKRGRRPAGAKVLASDDLSEMFGIEMAPATQAKRSASAVPREASPAATAAGSSRQKRRTPPAKPKKTAPRGGAGRRLTLKKRQAIAERIRRYWAERKARARRRKTSESP